MLLTAPDGTGVPANAQEEVCTEYATSSIVQVRCPETHGPHAFWPAYTVMVPDHVSAPEVVEQQWPPVQ
jgi:hypothetical protein